MVCTQRDALPVSPSAMLEALLSSDSVGRLRDMQSLLTESVAKECINATLVWLLLHTRIRQASR